MPAYPCAQCNSPVDVRDLVCRNCNNKKPFTCSKCSRRLDAMGIWNAEQVTFQKPLFCNACGPETQPVTCPNCKADVFRSAAVEDDGVFYHEECYKAVALQKKITRPLQFALLLFGGYAAYSQVAFYSQSQAIGALAGAFGAVVGYFLGGLMAPRR